LESRFSTEESRQPRKCGTATVRASLRGGPLRRWGSPAYQITAYQITAYQITAYQITAYQITAYQITAYQITAYQITA
jgi:hypothetical protein